MDKVNFNTGQNGSFGTNSTPRNGPVGSFDRGSHTHDVFTGEFDGNTEQYHTKTPEPSMTDNLKSTYEKRNNLDRNIFTGGDTTNSSSNNNPGTVNINNSSPTNTNSTGTINTNTNSSLGTNTTSSLDTGQNGSFGTNSTPRNGPVGSFDRGSHTHDVFTGEFDGNTEQYHTKTPEPSTTDRLKSTYEKRNNLDKNMFTGGKENEATSNPSTSTQSGSTTTPTTETSNSENTSKGLRRLGSQAIGYVRKYGKLILHSPATPVVLIGVAAELTAACAVQVWIGSMNSASDAVEDDIELRNLESDLKYLQRIRNNSNGSNKIGGGA